MENVFDGKSGRIWNKAVTAIRTLGRRLKVARLKDLGAHGAAHLGEGQSYAQGLVEALANYDFFDGWLQIVKNLIF